MDVCRHVESFREACDAVRASGGTLGLVPTMGALHVGHLALVTEARRHASHAAVTLFVNPTQFGPNEDLASYPRDLDGDLEKCERAGAALAFAPPLDEMYLPREHTRVHVAGLTDHLCGRSRPGHFEGVATIVTKLLSVSGPCCAVFGRKDYQQLKVIERMVRDLLLPVKVVGHPIVREPDGLALSSRNVYLSAGERRRAVAIPLALSGTVRRFAEGERNVGALREPVLRAIEQAGLRVDYATLADADEITPFEESAFIGDRALFAVAAFADRTRLIDNVVLGEDPAPISA